MKKYQKIALLEVVEITACGGYLVQNEGDPSDRWVIPKETFESTYSEVIGEEGYSTEDLADMQAEFGFDVAICLLKEGEKVARKGWNGKGMYLFLIGVSGSNDYWTYTNGKNDNYPLLPFIAMKTADNKVVPWLASQTDMLANDWMVVK